MQKKKQKYGDIKKQWQIEKYKIENCKNSKKSKARSKVNIPMWSYYGIELKKCASKTNISKIKRVQ